MVPFVNELDEVCHHLIEPEVESLLEANTTTSLELFRVVDTQFFEYFLQAVDDPRLVAVEPLQVIDLDLEALDGELLTADLPLEITDLRLEHPDLN